MTSEPVLSQERASTADNNSDINGVLIAGFLAITGTVVGGVVKGYWDTKLSEKDFQARLILRALEADDVHVRTSSLKFLVTTNLISSRKIRQGINELIKEGRDSIPKFGSSVNITSQFEPLSFILEKDEVGVYTIGYNHQLTSQELRDGYIIIDGQPTNFKDGITEQQAQKLLNQDLEPARKAVDKLVEVELKQNQREAIASFIFHVGLSVFERSSLLKKLNEGKYEDVPNEIRKWVQVSGVENPKLVKRREAEIELWNRNR